MFSAGEERASRRAVHILSILHGHSGGHTGPHQVNTQLILEADLQRKGLGHPTTPYQQVPQTVVPSYQKCLHGPHSPFWVLLSPGKTGPATEDHPGSPDSVTPGQVGGGGQETTHQDSFTGTPHLCVPLHCISPFCF